MLFLYRSAPLRLNHIPSTAMSAVLSFLPVPFVSVIALTLVNELVECLHDFFFKF